MAIEVEKMGVDPNANLKTQTAAEVRMQKELERQLNNDAGRAKIIETFAEIQEAEAKGETVPSWETDENQEEYNFIFRNGQEFNVIAPTLEFAKKQCELWLQDFKHVGEDWEVFDVEITDLEEIKDRFYKAPVMNGGNSETVVATLPNESEDFVKAFEAEDEEGHRGIRLSKEIVKVAGKTMEKNLTTLGPYVLPLSEQIKVVISIVARFTIKSLNKLFKTKRIPLVKVYVPDFKRGIDHFCIHAGGRAVIDGASQLFYFLI